MQAPIHPAIPVRAQPIHPGWLRATHWFNAIAAVAMATSGWRIHDAAPFFDLRFPREITLGGWLGGALQWHFASMWLLAFNGLVYLTLNLLSGRFARNFLPLTACMVLWKSVQLPLLSEASRENNLTTFGTCVLKRECVPSPLYSRSNLAIARLRR